MLVQVPVFIGLFHVLREFKPGKTENYFFDAAGNASFIDASFFGAKLGAWVTMGQDELVRLGTSMTQMIIVMIPLMIAAGIFTHITARHSVARQTAAQADNPQTAIMNKLMLYVFPIGVVVGAPFLPLAVLFYWVANNLWTLGQQYVVYRRIDAEESAKKDAAVASQQARAPRPAEARPPEASNAEVRPADARREAGPRRHSHRAAPHGRGTQRRRAGQDGPGGEERPGEDGPVGRARTAARTAPQGAAAPRRMPTSGAQNPSSSNGARRRAQTRLAAAGVRRGARSAADPRDHGRARGRRAAWPQARGSTTALTRGALRSPGQRSARPHRWRGGAVPRTAQDGTTEEVAVASNAEDQLVREGDIAGDYLERLLDLLDYDGDIDLDVEAGRAVVSIDGGEDLAKLVGDRGTVLEALQELTRLAVQQSSGNRSRLMLDIAGWRQARRAELTELGTRTAKSVLESGESVKLRPMTPFERKVVHDAVARIRGVSSESEGEEPRRQVVIFRGA